MSVEQVIHAAGECLDHPLHLHLEEDARELVDGNARLHRQHVEVQVIVAQQDLNHGFLFRGMLCFQAG